MKPVKLFEELGCLSWWSFSCFEDIADTVADFQNNFIFWETEEKMPYVTYFFYQGFCKRTLISRCGSAPTPHL